MAAEGSPSGVMHSPFASHQWGRGRMAAEGCLSPSQTQWPYSRVNGAAAGWPRKVENPVMMLVVALRQWGRGRMAAEG